MSKNLAAIDCGTNSIRLLISEVDNGTVVREIARENIIVRLGEGIDSTGKFSPDALQRVEQALETYTRQMQDSGVQDVMMVATSATRDASNKEEFFSMTKRYLGQIKQGRQAEVISGQKEAQLSFAGALQDLDLAPGQSACVIDLGGGSTEFVVGTQASEAQELQAYSADMGCVRITERYLHTDPPSEEEIAQARAFVSKLMETVNNQVDLSAISTVVGVAGTLTTMAAINLGLQSYQPEKIHMSTFPLAQFVELADILLHDTVDQRLEYPVMHPGRADVIGGGSTVVKNFCEQFMQQGLDTITISEKDILDGILTNVIAVNI